MFFYFKSSILSMLVILKQIFAELGRLCRHDSSSACLQLVR